jgi:hypothetical protein
MSIYVSSVKKFKFIYYNMLVQNHVNYNMLSKKISLWVHGAMVKNLTLQCEDEEFKVPHL